MAQVYIVRYPQAPLLERSLHVLTAVLLVLLWHPLGGGDRARGAGRLVDAAFVLGAVAAAGYYALAHDRLTNRMENVDPVLAVDVLFGVVTVAVLLEATRRAVGWNLLGVIVAFAAYGFLGPWFPGWLRFQGFGTREFIEILTMTGHGILGITTETSVQLVFYFLAFGAIYAAVGGGQLFMDVALKVAGRQPGGAAKAEVVSSALFGTVSGSAVANVTATGIFTIPLMIRSGYSRESAAAHEAVSSTGGQLMPPVMGIAAFVMAEILGVPYSRIALAATIPALAYFGGLYLLVDLKARGKGIGSLPPEELAKIAPVLGRLQLLIPPVVMIGLMVVDYSVTYAALGACLAAWGCGWLPGGRPITLRRVLEVTDDTARQAAGVAIPIAAIGVIIAVAVQSNLAIKFSGNLLEMSGGTLAGALVLAMLACIVLGMGLPTVAAYIIAAVLFVPAVKQLGVPDLAAHFYVFFYSVLSMITPPVALASMTAAGIAGANAWRTGWTAFALSVPIFLIPFAFVVNPAILWIGSLPEVLASAIVLLGGTAAWTICLVGHLRGRVGPPARLLYGALAVALMLAPLGWPFRLGLLGLLAGMVAWRLSRGPARAVRARAPISPA